MNIPKENAMKGTNSYGRELTQKEIDEKKHRNMIGGLWEELGRLQYEFLKSQGLESYHKLLDIGCGCLRGGLYYIRYLDDGNYYGLDINASLIQAGLLELREQGLEGKHPKLLVDDQFKADKFEEAFDFMVSISLFTHLPMNPIIRCLHEAKKCLKPDGVYFATFFQAPKPAHLKQLDHQPGGIVTKYDRDPFHYSFEELSWMASLAGLEARFIGDWNHPRNQKMAAFSINPENR